MFYDSTKVLCFFLFQFDSKSVLTKRHVNVQLEVRQDHCTFCHRSGPQE
jgi:hypothetical protein